MQRLFPPWLAMVCLLIFAGIQAGHYAFDLAHTLDAVHQCHADSDESSPDPSNTTHSHGLCDHGIHANGPEFLLPSTEFIRVVSVSTVTWIAGLFSRPDAPVASIDYPPQLG